MKSIIALILALPLLIQNGFVELSGNTVPLVRNGKSDYVIVRAADSTIGMAANANSLAKTIKSKTGSTVSVVKDNIAEKAGAAGSCEIILGKTNRSDMAFPSLDAEDFYLCENNGALHIYAESDAAYRSAEKYLAENFMTGVDFTIPKGYEYTYFKSYEVENMTLPGGKIDTYSLCYIGNYAKTMAEKFASEILAKTGKSLSVCDYSEAQSPYICFGDSGRTSTLTEWKATTEDGNIFISSQTGMGLDEAYKVLTGSLFDGNKNVTVTALDTSGQAAETSVHSEFFTLRTPLANTYKKLTVDKELNVVFFGGSVTNGYTPDNTDKYAWRQHVCAWLQKNFPQAQINQITSAIGGTGSKLGAFRVQRDVISKKPDLVFVEFSINDSYGIDGTDKVKETFEACVRQIRKAYPDCDIVTLFITDSIQISKKSFAHSEAHDEISAIYGIDSVNLGAAFAKKTGIVSPIDPQWKIYFSDNVHMTAEGYAEYAEVLIEYLAKRLIFETPSAPAPHALPAAQSAYADSEFRYILASDLEVSDSTGFKLNPGIFQYMLSDFYYGFYTPVSKENNLEFTFSGTELLLFMECPRNVHFYYELDGVKGHYSHQIGQFYPATFLSGLEPGEHKISIRISGTDYQKVQIGAFLTR